VNPHRAGEIDNSERVQQQRVFQKNVPHLAYTPDNDSRLRSGDMKRGSRGNRGFKKS
jgi:hypothetical protein